ncbi:BTB/POZ domain-containing protein [Dioscorea alata]|uniref:BTB/POZ domain-containing protein n=2 Tax=Dioscorea alata TaxID=55571 RepID=A0ACB7U2B6_DIOAL|nr:BTB/POZ domain-containing protein [Dioscorea alata]
MRSSSKAGRGGRRGKPLLSDHVIKVRQRLHEALALGIKVDDNKQRKWQCSDTEIQLHVLRAMGNFIGCVSPHALEHSIPKDSISDMFLALEAILCSRNERVLSFAADTTNKLALTLELSICQYDIWGVVVCLSRCLSKCQSQVVNSCVIAMDHILKSPGVMRWEKNEETWKVIKENNIVDNLVTVFQDDVDVDQSYEYFMHIASLFKTIILKCPSARYYVWKCSELIMKLGSICSHSNPSAAAAALELFATLALCGDVAMELLGNKQILSKAVQSMGPLQPGLVRVRALNICQSLMRSVKGCHMLINVYCEPVVQGIISALSEPSAYGQSAIRMGAFRVALIACWSGDHHLCFWKLGIDKVLFDILLGDCSMININQNPLPTEMLFSKIYECHVGERAYIWEILGWLAMYCEDKFLFKTDQRFWYLKVLISCVCSAAKVVMHRRHVKLPSSDNFEFEPVRATLQMLCSPSKYISSQAKHHLSECLQSDGHEHLEYLLESLTLIATGDVSLTSDSFQTAVNIVSLGCYSTLSEYEIPILEKRGVYIISAIINRCLHSDTKLSRSAIPSHIDRYPYIKACCWSDATDWEGENVVLFHCLQALAQLLNVLDRRCNHQKNSIGKVHCALCEISEAQFLVENLQYVLSKNFSPGTKSYAAYVLSFFNFYGFPSKLGKRLERTLGENELADLQFVFSSGQVLNAHSVIVLARCPRLLPSEKNLNHKKLGDVSTERHVFELKPSKFRREVGISEEVDATAFKKILEYVYSGMIQVEVEDVGPVEKIAKFCGLKSLLYMLQRGLPKWGLDTPICDLTQALEPACQAFTDISLEVKATEGVAWNCSICQLSMPHMCAHKVVLSSSCDYFRALFSSGMRDSNADVIKVPIGWNALVKLVKWMYSAELPRINNGCAWNNMDGDQQLSELQAYVELASLADYWLIDGFQEECLDAIIPLLNIDHQIVLKTIAIAAGLNQTEHS